METFAFLYVTALLIGTAWFLDVMIKLALEGNGISWLMIIMILMFGAIGCRGLT